MLVVTGTFNMIFIKLTANLIRIRFSKSAAPTHLDTFALYIPLVSYFSH